MAAQPEHLDAEAVEEALTTLLASYPHATITAVAWNGVFCEMPDSIPVTTQRLATVRKGIDLVPPDDRGAMLDQFAQAKQQGAATVHVHDREGRQATCYVLDTRERHGVLVLLFAVDEESPAVGVELPDLTPVPSKFGRVWRNAVAEITDADEGACQLTGFTREELVAAEPSTLIHPDDVELSLENWFQVLVTPPGVGHRGRSRHRRGDGSYVWLEFTNYNRLDDPEHNDILCELMDISPEMAAIDEVHKGRELLRRLTEALPLGVLQIDLDRNVVYTNHRLHQIVGIDERATLTEQMASVHPDDRAELDRAIDTVLALDGDLTIELRLQPPRASQLRICQVVVRTLREPGGAISGAILCVSDVTEASMLRRELENRATFDLLTGSYNRESVMTELERMLGRGVGASGCGLVFVDVNRFKPVNDRLGHAAGDTLLKIVARRLREAVRAEDLVGRIGGDEFLVLCPDVGDRDTALQVGRRIADHVNGPARLGGRASVDLSVSIGVAWAIGDHLDADALVALADEAMYRSKREGRGEPVLLTPSDRRPSPAPGPGHHLDHGDHHGGHRDRRADDRDHHVDDRDHHVDDRDHRADHEVGRA